MTVLSLFFVVVRLSGDERPSAQEYTKLFCRFYSAPKRINNSCWFILCFDWILPLERTIHNKCIFITAALNSLSLSVSCSLLADTRTRLGVRTVGSFTCFPVHFTLLCLFIELWANTLGLHN